MTVTLPPRPTEESLMRALYWTQYVQGNATARHASVGEPYTWATKGDETRAQHGVRRIDALVLRRNLRKGDTLWAVEIKVTAADLQRELQTPDKTETWARYTHGFYFLVPTALADYALDRIPPEYGVMTGASRVTIVRRARRNPSPDPLPLDTWRRILAKLGEYQMRDIERAYVEALEARNRRTRPQHPTEPALAGEETDHA